MEWTDEQKAIFECFASGAGNLLIVARAGAAKTTSTLHGAAQARQRLKLVTAFNKRIADELVAKAPEGVNARTLHSLGLGYLRRRGNPQLEKWRGRNLVRTAWGELRAADPNFPKADSEYNKLIAKLVSLAKSVMPFAEKWEDFHDLAIAFNMAPAAIVVQHTGITLEHMSITAELAMRLAHETYKNKVDFDDMIFVPLRKGWITPAFDLVCVDEGQDMSPGQMELVMRALKPNGRFCAVLDPAQAIYQFRGADSEVLNKLRDRFKPTELSLTTSFRCAKSIVREARRYVPDIRARDDAPDGQVNLIEDCYWLRPHEVTGRAEEGDFVLSRTNAPLIGWRFAFLREGIKSTIIGAEEFGAAVKSVVHAIWESLDDQSAAAFKQALADWWVGERKDIDDDADPRTSWVDDIHEALSIIMDTAKSGDSPAEFIFEIATRVEQVFSGDGHGVELSTVHKAKGREADRVFVLGETFPSISKESDQIRCICGSPKWAHDCGEIKAMPRCNRRFTPDLEWLKAEQNIRYVAITRARSELYYVGRAI
jgi:DNA helicase-2/ATP-dependent DNA helicase PcrA